MKIVRKGPLKASGRQLTSKQRQATLARCEAIRRQGDRALNRGRPSPLAPVGRRTLRQAFNRLSPQARAALELACRHTGAVARRELAALKEFDLKPTAGLTVHQRWVPFDSAAVVVGDGRIATLLGGAIAAAVAGVARRVVALPEGADTPVESHLLAAAYMCDVTELYPLSGVDAVAALAYGTATVAAVDCVAGAGDRQTLAAQQHTRPQGPALLAGPAELLVIADDTAAPEFVAADLLAHAAADADAGCVLVTTSSDLAEAVRAELKARQRRLASTVARGPLRRAQAAVVDSLAEAVALANGRAPAQVAVQVKRPDEVVGGLTGHATLLVGPHSPAALVTRVGGAAALALPGPAATGAVGVSAFLRRVTVQQVDPSAYLRLSRAASTLAELDGLDSDEDALAERVHRVDPQD